MNTRILNITEESDLESACELLKKGDLVAFPTETVYGLGANALD
jgi:L-threonylcarbamoyladenylate synthase